MVRLLLLTALCAMAACAAVPPSAEPFRSDRISVEAIGSGPDVVLITGLASHPEVFISRYFIIFGVSVNPQL